MIMRAKREGEVIVFALEGQLDFETTVQFREACTPLLKKNSGQKVVFNLAGLKFVGSSGINQFIRILKEFNVSKDKPKICQLSPEFLRLFRVYQTNRNPFHIFETEIQAVQSFSLPSPSSKKVNHRKGGSA